MSKKINEHQHSIMHLLAELERINVLLQYRLCSWAAEDQDPPVSLEPDEEQAFAGFMEQAAQEIRTILARGKRHNIVSRLEYLQTVFDLDEFECDLFLICLAPVLDVETERLYSALQDDARRTRASVDLALTLLGLSHPQKMIHLAYFQAQSRLFKHHLLEIEPLTPPMKGGASLLSRLVWPSESVVAWLLGCYEPQASLAQHIRLSRPDNIRYHRLLAGALLEDVTPLLSESPILALYGPDGSRQDAVAAIVAEKMGIKLLTVDLAALKQQGADVGQSIRLALRDATLNRAIPYFKSGEAGGAKGVWLPACLERVCAYPGLVIVGRKDSWHVKHIERQRRFVMLETPAPRYGHRYDLWSAFVGQCAPGPAIELDSLAAQFRLTTGQIRDAVAEAQDKATQRGSRLRLADLYAAARIHSRPGLSDLAQRIEPRYGMDDIVLSPDQRQILKEIVDTVRCRTQVLERWGVGEKLVKSAAVAVLFAGPPGTGKTMAAEVIASELGFDLYKINLSSVVSKYIGETEKNLERIFAEAQNSNIILFFDEADSIFGKRTEVRDSHDRHANTQVSYLLQRMESYDGVTILATNQSQNLDEAFTRRLHFVLHIPKPNLALRLQIWHALFPGQVPRAAELDLDLMARRFDLAGGNIRNIIVAATYLAAADGQLVTMGHLFHATRRELEKMGRLIVENDLTK